VAAGAASRCGARGGHAGEHLALRRRQPTGPMTVFTSSTRRCGCRGRTSRTWAASPSPRVWRRPRRAPPCCSTTARAQAGDRGDRGGVPRDPPRAHPRVDAARQEPGPSAGTALGGVGEGRRPSHRGRLEGAVGPRRLHGLRDVRAHFLVGSWKDGAGATHVFLCDGYAATAEAMQAASLSDVLEVHSTMSLFSPTFELPVDAEGRLMQLDPSAPDFAERLKTLIGGRDIDAGTCAPTGRHPRGGGLEHAARQAGAARRDFLRRRAGRCSRASATCARTPTRARPASRRWATVPIVSARCWRRGRPRAGSPSRCGSWRASRRRAQVFSPLLVRFLSGVDHTRGR